MDWQVIHNGERIASFYNGQKLKLKTQNTRIVSDISISPYSIDDIFGDGSDGDIDITSSVTWNPSQEDTGEKL